MEPLANAAEWFIGLFQEGADFFIGFMEVIPLVIVLLTLVNTIIKLVGQERVNKVGEWAARPGWIYTPIRFLIFPVLAVFFLTNPAAYTLGTFLPERNKPAFYDSAVSFVHPITSLFPHANPAELFVWLGIAEGVENAGLSTADLAVRYLLVGLVVIFIRGIVTQIITDVMLGRRARQQEETAPAGGA